jgi:hypothetical protein
MPSLTSLPFPRAVSVVMDLLTIVPTIVTVNGSPLTAGAGLSVPPGYQGDPFYVVRRVGGTPDPDDLTDHPIILLASYAESYATAAKLSDLAQVRILSSGCTSVNGVLVDTADIYVGEQEVPDEYADERRIVETYEFSWRRQFPAT